ncbi:MAG: hypothetical protein DI539_20845 [Flavobacterium psychrophilum]|nr:MAG: hypothetical protein DI539_20845 [Flavobacterium psychrophilum]
MGLSVGNANFELSIGLGEQTFDEVEADLNIMYVPVDYEFPESPLNIEDSTSLAVVQSLQSPWILECHRQLSQIIHLAYQCNKLIYYERIGLTMNFKFKKP